MNQRNERLFAIQISTGSAIDNNVQKVVYLKDACNWTDFTENYKEALRMPRYEATMAFTRLSAGLEMQPLDPVKPSIAEALTAILVRSKPYDPAHITIKLIEPADTVVERYSTLMLSKLHVHYTDRFGLRAFFNHDEPPVKLRRRLDVPPGEPDEFI